MKVPPYLAEPDLSGRTYGTVRYDEGSRSYIIEAEPMVLEMARRLFPGCDTRKRGTVRFPATVRSVGDLNWLMLRYPLRVLTPEKWREDRERAVAHGIRRERNQDLQQVIPPPTFRGQLLPYQAEGVDFLIKNERALLADDMGLGKTVTALAALATARAFPAVVVAPPNVQEQWRRQAAVFLDLLGARSGGEAPGGEPAASSPAQAALREAADPVSFPVRTAAAAGAGIPLALSGAVPALGSVPGEELVHIIRGRKPYALPSLPLYVIHYGLLQDWREVLVALRPEAVIFDEIQELRHTGTLKYSAASLLAQHPRYVWGLSGTPIYNRGGEIWAIMNILSYHCLGDREAFTREWCWGYGSDEVANPELLGEYLRREGLMLRRRKQDVLHQLPPKRRIVHYINRDEGRYSQLIAEAVRLARQYDQIRSWRERGMALRQIEGAARLATGLAKAPYVSDFVDGLLRAGERVLLYCHHHAVSDFLMERLAAWRPARISGQETPAEKDRAVRAFAEGKTDLVLLSLRSTAGIDGLQGRGTCVVFAELDWSPAVHSQCEDRLHRQGISAERESVLCYYLVTDTGMDEVMLETLGVKVGQFVGLMGDTAETEEDRRLAQQAAERHMQRVIEQLKRHRI